jgi:hypothetical protein
MTTRQSYAFLALIALVLGEGVFIVLRGRTHA